MSSVAKDRIKEQREAIVSKILEDMKRDGLRWAEPYLPFFSPSNAVDGNIYRGGNRIHLAFIASQRRLTDNRWCTFHQIDKKGWHLKKGAKAARIEKWKTFLDEVVDKDKKPIFDENGKPLVKKTIALVGYWSVFNAAEIEGIPPAPAPTRQEDEKTIEIADRLITSSRCPIVESPSYRNLAAYVPATDKIVIAPRETFRSDELFVRVTLHEMTHSTGHPKALNRPSNTDFGSPEYAKEELVAELGSLFLSSDLGLQRADYEGEYYEQHVAYLKSWMAALEEDPSYLFSAASKAHLADEYIMERYKKLLEPEREQEVPEKAAEKDSATPDLAGEARDMREASCEKETAGQKAITLENNIDR